MNVVDLSKHCGSSACYQTWHIASDGSVREACDEVQAEHVLCIYANGTLAMRLVCSPRHLKDLVVGRLFSEGVVSSIDEIVSIHLSEDGHTAHVELAIDERASEAAEDACVAEEGAEDIALPDVPTTGQGNRVYVGCPTKDDPLRKVKPIEWDPAWVFDLSQRLAADTPMHKRTWGSHSCFLSIGGEACCCREDIGRHNAFDKVLGFALRRGLDLSQSVVYSSGRLPVDMVTKAIRARIPVLATKAVPTDKTIELARAYDLTLICSARPDSMRVFCDPMREQR